MNIVNEQNKKGTKKRICLRILSIGMMIAAIVGYIQFYKIGIQVMNRQELILNMFKWGLGLEIAILIVTLGLPITIKLIQKENKHYFNIKQRSKVIAYLLLVAPGFVYFTLWMEWEVIPKIFS